MDLLPGLIFLAAAATLTLVLHRFYDRLPAAVPGGFGLVVVTLFGRVLFGGEYLLPLDGLRGQAPFSLLAPSEPPGNPIQGDLLHLTLPLTTEVDRAFATGRWPLWSDRLGAGLPLLANPQAQVLQPLAAPGRILPAPQAAAVTAALRVYVALLFTWLLLRRQGLSSGAAWLGAAAWGLGGFVQLWLGWPLANTAALLPALLYALARRADGPARHDLVLLTGVLSGLLLAGHPETILYALALGACFLASRIRPLAGAAARLRALRQAGAAFLLAAAIAAPALLPAATLLPRSLRATQAKAAEPVAPEAMRRLALRLLPVAVPNAFGNDRYGAYWGGANVNEDAAGFVGTASLLLAALALVPGRIRRPGERLVLAATGFSLLVIAQPPGLADLFQAIPGGAVSGLHHRLLLLVGFGLAYAAACEADRWSRGEGSRLAALALAALLVALHFWAFDHFRSPRDPALLEVLRWGWVHWHLRFLGIATLLLLLGRRRRELPAALGLAAAAELFLLHGPANPPQPPRLLLPETPALAFLRTHLEPDQRIAGEGLALTPNLAALYGLNDARCYDPTQPAVYLAATDGIRIGWASEVPLLGRWEDPRHDALGIRYLVAPPGTPPPSGLALAFNGPDAAVWERPRPRPRFELTSGTVAVASRENAHLRLRARATVDSTLVARVLQDGGWRTLIDGRRAPVPGIALPFVGAGLPAGEHRVDLVYRPLSFVAGCLLAGLGLTGLLALVRRPRPLPAPARSPRP